MFPYIYLPQFYAPVSFLESLDHNAGQSVSKPQNRALTNVQGILH